MGLNPMQEDEWGCADLKRQMQEMFRQQTVYEDVSLCRPGGREHLEKARGECFFSCLGALLDDMASIEHLGDQNQDTSWGNIDPEILFGPFQGNVALCNNEGLIWAIK